LPAPAAASALPTRLVPCLLGAAASFSVILFFFFQAEDGIRDRNVTGVQTCALPILSSTGECRGRGSGAAPAGSVDCCSWALRWRSEERRVGKECRSRGWPDQEKGKERERGGRRRAGRTRGEEGREGVGA